MIDTSKFRYATDIELSRSDLIEAWLTVKWELDTSDDPNFPQDPQFPFALGKFYDGVQDEFPYLEELPITKVGSGLLPHVVSYRFRAVKGGFPLLNLGPGIASINFGNEYTWERFKQGVDFFRAKLRTAYKDKPRVSSVVLRYRNQIPFDNSKQELSEFITQNLNTVVQVPRSVPGDASVDSSFHGINIQIAYGLQSPLETGTVRVQSVTQVSTDEQDEQSENRYVRLELEILTANNAVPQLQDDEAFDHWLNDAHAVCHEWFFSLIDGPLLEKYRKR